MRQLISTATVSKITISHTTQMTDIVDPFSYRDRLTMPKLVVDSTGDEFFMVCAQATSLCPPLVFE
jgi:PhoPQ-activated pathogenicity-related protein